MPRKLRIAPENGVFHVLNRRAGRLPLFEHDGDYHAFEKVLEEAIPLYPIRLLAYCLMPNHWHLLVQPLKTNAMSRFMHRLTLTHMRRWHAHRNTVGTGPVYQGRFKSFPIQDDGHMLTVARYIERNPLRSNAVKHAEQWRWSSLHRRVYQIPTPWLTEASDWPIPPRRDWLRWVNEPQTDRELEAIRLSVNRGRPFGDSCWQMKIARRLKLQQSLRDPWRPKLRKNKGT